MSPPPSALAEAPTWTAMSSAVCWAAAPRPVTSEDLPQPPSASNAVASQRASLRALERRFIGLLHEPGGPRRAPPLPGGQSPCHAAPSHDRRDRGDGRDQIASATQRI